MSGRKNIVWLIGGIVAFLAIGLALFFVLFGGVVLLGYLTAAPTETTNADQRPLRRPIVYVTFAPPLTETPAAGSASQSSTPPAEVQPTLASPSAVAGNAQSQPTASSTPTAPAQNTTAPTSTITPPAVTPTIDTVNATAPVAATATTTPVSVGNSPLATPTPTATGTLPPTATATATATASPTSSATPTTTNTPTPAPARISGLLTRDGSAVGGVALRLEDQSYNIVAETTAGGDGVFTFDNLSPSDAGYNVLFSQEWNSQLQSEDIVSWGWIGPVTVENGSQINLPDFEISTAGFKQIKPKASAAFSAAQITGGTPIVFEWVQYPQATDYWVDVAQGSQQAVVWQSDSTGSTSLSFDGTLNDGSVIQPGAYWWGIGARRTVDGFNQTVYGYLVAFAVEL